MHELYESSEPFQVLYRDFEQQKICYIPIGGLVLKPLHRLLHYQLILESKLEIKKIFGIIVNVDLLFSELLQHYGADHIDRTDCQGTLVMLGRTTDQVRKSLPAIENYGLLCELQRDMSGFDRLVQPDRKLIRQGCLLKHSRRGLQQRMFFLVIIFPIYDTMFCV